MSELAIAVYAGETGSHQLERPRTAQFASFARGFDDREFGQRLADRGLRFLGRSEPTFPPLLRAIHDPPIGLFVRGTADLELLARHSVAVVGARACSAYGRHVARLLGRELAAAGLVVVAGSRAASTAQPTVALSKPVG
jgi:predicted Rossmann fold nucleotide-binding protein DprA/Smf involved in DNA uptake